MPRATHPNDPGTKEIPEPECINCHGSEFEINFTCASCGTEYASSAALNDGDEFVPSKDGSCPTCGFEDNERVQVTCVTCKSEAPEYCGGCNLWGECRCVE